MGQIFMFCHDICEVQRASQDFPMITEFIVQQSILPSRILFEDL